MGRTCGLSYPDRDRCDDYWNGGRGLRCRRAVAENGWARAEKASQGIRCNSLLSTAGRRLEQGIWRFDIPDGLYGSGQRKRDGRKTNQGAFESALASVSDGPNVRRLAAEELYQG